MAEAERWKISGHAFDPETKAPILTVSHMKLPVYK